MDFAQMSYMNMMNSMNQAFANARAAAAQAEYEKSIRDAVEKQRHLRWGEAVIRNNVRLNWNVESAQRDYALQKLFGERLVQAGLDAATIARLKEEVETDLKDSEFQRATFTRMAWEKYGDRWRTSLNLKEETEADMRERIRAEFGDEADAAAEKMVNTFQPGRLYADDAMRTEILITPKRKPQKKPKPKSNSRLWSFLSRPLW